MQKTEQKLVLSPPLTKGRFAMSTGTAVWKGPVETANGLLATSDMV